MATSAPNPPLLTPLGSTLVDQIRRLGPMAFEAFMAQCLYDPGHGYYASPLRVVGQSGDFLTSVAVGPVFGELVAEWVTRSWETLGRPEPIALVEQGAHDGQLMVDVLAALRHRHPALCRAAQPVIVEPLPARREIQRAHLEEAAARAAGGRGPAIAWVASLEELAARRASWMLFFANELLDAFPVARWRFDGSTWHRLMVGWEEGRGFTWQTEPAPVFLLPGVELGAAIPFPVGYETETCPDLGTWTRQLAAAMPRGRALVIDYGREADDYFAPHRTAGTLRGYRDHRRCDDPFAAPGETDLTADVNFSHLAEVAREAGWVVGAPERQGGFLTRLATPLLLADPPPDAAWRRQFQTLTHPNHLGHLFHAVVLEKPAASPPFSQP